MNIPCPVPLEDLTGGISHLAFSTPCHHSFIRQNWCYRASITYCQYLLSILAPDLFGYVINPLSEKTKTSNVFEWSMQFSMYRHNYRSKRMWPDSCPRMVTHVVPSTWMSSLSSRSLDSHPARKFSPFFGWGWSHPPLDIPYLQHTALVRFHGFLVCFVWWLISSPNTTADNILWYI